MADKFVEISVDVKGAQDFIASLGGYPRWTAILKRLVQTIGLRDVVDHFRREQGPDGQWKPRAASTQRAYENIRSGRWYPDGKSRRLGNPLPAARAAFNPSNKLLQLTGNLRQNFLPTNIRDEGELAVALFNPVKYAGRHDTGNEMPKRQFMWLSSVAMKNMEQGFLHGLLGARNAV